MRITVRRWVPVAFVLLALPLIFVSAQIMSEDFATLHRAGYDLPNLPIASMLRFLGQTIFIGMFVLLCLFSILVLSVNQYFLVTDGTISFKRMFDLPWATHVLLRPEVSSASLIVHRPEVPSPTGIPFPKTTLFEIRLVTESTTVRLLYSSLVINEREEELASLVAEVNQSTRR